MTRLDDVISRVRSGDKSVFTDTSTQITGQAQKQTAQTPQLTGSRLEQIIARVKSGDKTVFKDQTTYYARPTYSAENKSQISGVLGAYNPETDAAAGKQGWADYLDTQERIAQNRKETEKNKTFWQKIGEYLGGVQDTSLPLHLTGEITKGIQDAENALMRPADDWTEGEQAAFGYLWNTEREKAYQYAYALNTAKKQAQEAIVKQQAQQKATQNFGSGALHTIGSVLSAPIGGTADFLEDVIAMGTLGRLPSDDGKLSPYEYSEAVKSGISQNLNKKHGTINENVPIIGGKGWGDVYSLGTSAANSLLSAYSGGGAQALITMLGPSVESGINDAKSRGATDEQAMSFGFLTGTAEAAAEMIGVDNLLKIGASDSLKALIKNILKQGAAEGLEEGITSVLNNFADQLVMADKSNFNLAVQEYVSKGMSQEEAKKRAWLDMAEDVAFDMLGGFATGTFTGGVQTGIQTGIQNHQGKKITGNQLNQMVQKNEAALKAKDVQAIQDAAQRRLEALGEPEGAKVTAEAIAKKTAGQELSKADEVQIYTSKYAQQVMNELNAENIRSGKYDAGWTGDIHTERVNTDVYGKTAATDVLVGAKMTEKATDPEAVVTNQHGSSEEAEEYGRRLAEWEKRNAEGQFNSVGAASEGFTPPGPLDYLNEKYGEQDTRPGDRRYVSIPKKDASGRAVSDFAGNAYGSYLTTDSFASVIEQLTLRGELSHDTLANGKVLEDAAQTIAEDGISKSISEIQETAEKGFARPEDIAKGTLLYRYLLEMTDEATDIDVKEQLEDLTAEVFTSLMKMATSAGRSTQLFSLFRRMSPSGQIKTIENDIRAYVERMKRLNQLPVDYVAPSLSADNPLFQAFAEASEAERAATTNKEKAEARKRMADAEDEIYKFIASQIPATQKNRWDAWRHLCMMGNVRTQLRNFISTAAFMPYRSAKQALGAVIEKSIPQEQRTKAVIGFSKADRALLAWAKQDRTNVDVQRALRYSARLGDNAASAFIEDHRKIYKNKKLEEVRKFVRKVPQEADLLFKNVEYAKSLAGFLKARGYTEADILSAKVPDDVLTEGREYAIHDAMVATFNDTNALSDAAVALRYTGKNKPLRLLSMLGEGAAPYRRTTANLAVRGFEYSAAGLAQGLWNSARNVKDGKITAAQAIDQISAGLTGTVAACLGFALAGGLLGLRIRGNSLDEGEKRNGAQEYSLEFSFGGKDYSYKIDWVGPAALPLFLGANIRDALEVSGQNPDTSLFTKSAVMAKAVFDPMIDMTILSTMNDVLMDARYASEGTELLTVMTSLATSYFTQGIPALARQLVQAINEWGEGDSQGSLLRRLFDSFVNPGALREIDNSHLSQEITRLNQSQAVNASPPDLQKTISYKSTDGKTVYSDRRLTAQEYNALEKTQGQLQQDLASALISSVDYAALSDEQKAMALQDIYSYAREKARMSVFSDYPGYSESWMADIEGGEIDAIICRQADHSISRAFLSLTDAWDSGFSDEEAIAALDAAYNTLMALTAQNRATVMENMSGGRMSAFVAAREAGVTSAVFAKLYKKYRQINASENTASAKAREWAVALAVAKEYDDLTTDQADVLKNKLSFYAHIRQEAGRYDDMVSGGLSPEAADHVAQLVDSITAEQGYASVRNIQQLEAIARDNTLTDRQQEQALRAYMGDSLEEKYDKALSKGIGSDDFVEAYRAYLDTDKKQSFITYCVQELHVSYTVAQTLYDIYGGKK